MSTDVMKRPTTFDVTGDELDRAKAWDLLVLLRAARPILGGFTFSTRQEAVDKANEVYAAVQELVRLQPDAMFMVRSRGTVHFYRDIVALIPYPKAVV